jgi:putative protease
MDMLKAAVLNGADAVYFGAKKFNARIPAENFSAQGMADAVDFCHLHGKKAYLALNTLIKDSEMAEAIGIAKNAYCLGIDAVIVQDLGLLKALHELLPGLELHASTQMNCHNGLGAQFLRNRGVKRAILSRELSLGEIRAIRKSSNVEIECFVHGAMCFSYSGQCLFSSFCFNKSGNRGMCLQPCRLAYSLKCGGSGKAGSEKKGFILSMKDLMAVGRVRELVEAGIDSFKVEGRLKGVEYAASVARAYRIAIDACFGGSGKVSEQDIDLMKIAFMRRHSTGYLLGEKELVFPEASARMGVKAATVLGFKGQKIVLSLHRNLSRWDRLSVVRGDKGEQFSAVKIFVRGKELARAFKGQVVEVETGKKPFLEKGQGLFSISSTKLRDSAYASIKSRGPVQYDLHVVACKGKKLSATASFLGKKSEIVSGFVPEESKKLETGAKLIEGKLLKSDDFFSPGKFSCEISGKPFLPLSELKKFKNEIMRGMRECLFSEHRKQVEEKAFLEKTKGLLSAAARPDSSKKGKQRVAIFADRAELFPMAADAADTIVCYGSMPEKAIREIAKSHPEKDFFVKSDAIQQDSELLDFEKKFVEQGKKVVCSNLGALQAAINGGARFWAGRELNAFNSLAVKLLLELGAEAVVPSVECSLKQLQEMNFSGRVVPLVFFYPVLMVSRAYANEGICREGILGDRKGFTYRTRFDEKGIFRIFNPMPVDMLFELDRFAGFRTVALDFNAATQEEAVQAMQYRGEKRLGKRPVKKFSKFTRGHYGQEVY